MAVVQNSYSENIGVGRAGMVATMNAWDGDTRIVETAAGIGFGLACGKGSDDKGCVLGAAAAAAFRGISIRDVTLESSQSDKYARYQNIALLTKGVIWVTVGGNVQEGQDATFDSTTGVLSSAATSGTQFQIPGAVWLDTVTNGGLARLKLTGQMTPAT